MDISVLLEKLHGYFEGGNILILDFCNQEGVDFYSFMAKAEKKYPKQLKLALNRQEGAILAAYMKGDIAWAGAKDMLVHFSGWSENNYNNSAVGGKPLKVSFK